MPDLLCRVWWCKAGHAPDPATSVVEGVVTCVGEGPLGVALVNGCAEGCIEVEGWDG